jgi:deazaflavin-dependent oxidoreductase (nitroreductase family)
MPVPRQVARFQRRFLHPVVRNASARLPGYGLLLHIGRKSGRVYRTPLNVFTTPDGFAIVLAYGRDSDWLRNVQASGGGEILRRGHRYLVSNPRIVSRDEARHLLPRGGRLASLVTRSPDVLLVDAKRA